MNRKQFLILIVLLVVLGGASYVVHQKSGADTGSGESGAGQLLLGDKFPLNDVTQVTIQNASNTVNLVKQDDLWRVRERADYPANFGDISSFLIKASQIKVTQVEEIGPSQFARFQMLPPGQGTNSGTLVELKDKDGKVIQTLTFGKKHFHKGPQNSPFGDEGFPDGRYVMVGGNQHSALLVNDGFANIEPKPEQWLKKDFFHVERAKAVSVDFPGDATNSWKLVRDTESGDWKFADAHPEDKLDSGKSYGVTTPFSSPMFNDIAVPPVKVEDYGLDKPTVVTVQTFDDFTWTVKVGKKTGDNYPLTVSVAANFPKERVPAKDEKPEDKAKADKAWADRQKELQDKLTEDKTYENWTYLLPSYSVDPLLKQRKDLLPDKKDDTKTADKTAENGAEPTKTADAGLSVTPSAMPPVDAK